MLFLFIFLVQLRGGSNERRAPISFLLFCGVLKGSRITRPIVIVAVIIIWLNFVFILILIVSKSVVVHSPCLSLWFLLRFFKLLFLFLNEFFLIWLPLFKIGWQWIRKFFVWIIWVVIFLFGSKLVKKVVFLVLNKFLFFLGFLHFIKIFQRIISTVLLLVFSLTLQTPIVFGGGTIALFDLLRGGLNS